MYDQAGSYTVAILMAGLLSVVSIVATWANREPV